MKPYFSHDEGARNDPKPQRVVKYAVHEALKAQHQRGDFRKLCLQCQAETKPPRRTFCSDACVHHWKLKTSTGYVRQCVEARDKGVCGCCGVDTNEQQRAFYAYQMEQRELDRAAAVANGVWPMLKMTPEQRRVIYDAQERRDLAWCAEIGVAKGDIYKSWWQADHIVPVAEGGGECGLDNYQTLCLKCHKAKTAEQARRKAAARRTAPLFQ